MSIHHQYATFEAAITTANIAGNTSDNTPDNAPDNTPDNAPDNTPAELTRQLPPAVVRALHQSNLLRTLLPEAYAGLGTPLTDFCAVVQRCASQDASSAWCLCQGAVIATISGWLPAATASELWAGHRVAIANGPPITGQAKWHGKTLVASGEWGLSSGFHHATHLTAAIRIEAQGNKPPEWVMLFFPKDQATLLDDWHTTGLQQTGSVKFSISNLSIDERWVARTSAPATVPAPILQLPTGLCFALGFAALALGVARAALNDCLELMHHKSPRYSASTLAADTDAQRVLGHSEARWQAATALHKQTTAAAWTAATMAVVQDTKVSNEVKVAMRTAGTFGLREAGAIMHNAWQIAGTSGIYTGHPLHQRYQDMQVITQHAQARESHYAWIGRYLGSGDYEPGPLN